MSTILGGRIVTPDGIVDGGVIEIVDGRIESVSGGSSGASASRGSLSGNPAQAGDSDVLDADGAWVVPGFIDLHMHGGGGYDVTGSPADMAAAVAFHRGQGTTRTLVSLMAQPVDATCEQLGWIADLTTQGQVLGAHLEGPFLSGDQSGAQRVENLADPDVRLLQRLLDAGQGSVRTTTIAPELPGALDLIAFLVRAGVVAAIGHTAASYDQAMAGIDAGATLATHVFNAMGAFSQRSPGAAGAALDGGIFLEVIGDGTHLHDSLLRLISRAAPDRMAFITDAISAAGASDGEYTLGDQAVRVVDGHAHLAHSTTLAGSTVTMADTLRRAVGEVGLTIETAVAATSTTPARVLGLSDRYGSIAPGRTADLVVLDEELCVNRVIVQRL